MCWEFTRYYILRWYTNNVIYNNSHVWLNHKFIKWHFKRILNTSHRILIPLKVKNCSLSPGKLGVNDTTLRLQLLAMNMFHFSPTRFPIIIISRRSSNSFSWIYNWILDWVTCILFKIQYTFNNQIYAVADDYILFFVFLFFVTLIPNHWYQRLPGEAHLCSHF